jgi:hypothetical protein
MHTSDNLVISNMTCLDHISYVDPFAQNSTSFFMKGEHPQLH